MTNSVVSRPTERQKKIIITWLITGAVMVFIMVMIGGITRLTHSGLSMVDWNLFMGSIPPMNEADWQDKFDQYKQFPEFQELNYQFTLEDFKSIFWWEFIHRDFGRLIGLVFLFPFLFFWWKKWLNPVLMRQLLLAFFLGAFQAFLGWFMVKSGLSQEPRVSHYRLAAHLITAFLTCGWLIWVVAELKWPERGKIAFPGIRKGIVWLIVLTLIQILYGAFVAGLRAGWVHNTFPLMDGQLIADSVWLGDSLLESFLQGKSGVQFVHRTLAMILFAGVLVLYFKAMRLPIDKLQVRAIRLTGLIVMIQFLLGVVTLLLQVPIALGILHQLGALLLLLTLVFGLHRFRSPS
ncbi:COX15/CtaA family protein [bacterium SCSIO 12741]|nr:COX15/CtaA family protein [bacterium SCSIO 12741]